MNISELIGHWRLRVHRMQIAHYDSEAYFSRLHLYLGVPVIGLSTIVGTSVFASLRETAQMDPTLQITVGLFSVTAAVLSGLQTFLGYSERAEKHRLGGARFAGLKTRIELIASSPPKTEDDLNQALAAFQLSWSELSEETPGVPPRIWHRVEQRMTYDESAKKYAMDHTPQLDS